MIHLAFFPDHDTTFQRTKLPNDDCFKIVSVTNGECSEDKVFQGTRNHSLKPAQSDTKISFCVLFIVFFLKHL